MELSQIPKQGQWSDIADVTNENFNKVNMAVVEGVEQSTKAAAYASGYANEASQNLAEIKRQIEEMKTLPSTDPALVAKIATNKADIESIKTELYETISTSYKSVAYTYKGSEGYKPNGDADTPSSGYFFYKFDAKKGDSFKIQISAIISNVNRSVVTLLSNGAFVKSLYIGDAKYVSGYVLEFTITDSCDSILVFNGASCLCERKENSKISKIDSIQEIVKNIEYSVSEIQGQLFVIKKVDCTYKSKGVNGYTPNGESFEPASGYYFYEFDARKNDRFSVIFSALVTNTQRAVVTCIKNGAFVKCIQIGDPAFVAGYKLEFTITEDCDAILILNGPTCTCERYKSIPISEYIENLVNDGNAVNVKICLFGNSFTQDSMSYVPLLLKSLAPDLKFTIGMGYIGGCPLVQHATNFTGVNQTLNGQTYTPKAYYYTKFTNDDNAWKEIGDKSVDYIINDEEWDILTFQQNGGAAFQSYNTYYAPFIYKLQKAVFGKVKKSIKLGWILTHGSYGDSDKTTDLQHYNGTATNSQKVMDETAFELLFPYGTALQNLRGTSVGNLGDSGDLLYDNIHIQEGIGCLTAAYANALTILNAVGMDNISIIGDNVRPSAEWCSAINVQAPHGSVIGITEANVWIAQASAIMAIKKPYSVTNITSF